MWSLKHYLNKTVDDFVGCSFSNFAAFAGLAYM